MATDSKKPGAIGAGIGLLLGALATWLSGHAVPPASAAQIPAGLATAAQVAALDGKVDRFIERITSIELKQAVQAEQIRQATETRPADYRHR